jgi:putative acetyltransferase
MELRFKVDDLRGAAVRDLIAHHLRGMFETSPPESVHALDIDKLLDPAITVWSAWHGDELAGIGALKMLDHERGELKSMRVGGAYIGRGVGRAILNHILAEARVRDLRSLWLETGAEDFFIPAVRMYESVGFTRCEHFADYKADPNSIFLTLTL